MCSAISEAVDFSRAYISPQTNEAFIEEILKIKPDIKITYQPS